MSEKVNARLSVSLDVCCPHCDKSIDLFDIDYLNDDSNLWNVIETWGRYVDKNGRSAWENLEQEFNCPDCKKPIIWDSVEY